MLAKSGASFDLIPKLQNTQYLTPTEYSIVYRIKFAPPDGHCLIHSLLFSINCGMTSLNLLNSLVSEFYANLFDYSLFCTDVDLVMQFNNYIYNKVYNSSAGDMIPLIAANAINRSIIVYNSNFNITNTIHPRNISLLPPARVIFRNEHYDALFIDSEACHALISSSSHKVYKSSSKSYLSNSLNATKPKPNRFTKINQHTRKSVPSILLTNCRSINNKFEEAINKMKMENCMINIFTESWLKEDQPNNLIQVDGFSIIRVDRVEKNGGGILCYIKDNIEFTTILSYNVQSSSFLCVFIISVKTLLIAIYHPYWGNSPNHDLILDLLYKTIPEHLNKFNCDKIVICGDFNGLINHLNEISSTFNLTNMVNFNTRGKSSIDCILTNTPQLFQPAIQHSPLGLSDHCVITLKPKLPTISSNFRKIHVYDYKPSCRKIFHDLMNSMVLDASDTHEDIHQAMELLLSSVINAHDYAFPIKTIRCYLTNKPWMKKSILVVMALRDKAFQKRNMPLFLHYRNKIKKMIKTSKSNFGNNISNLCSKKDWMSLKSILGLKLNNNPYNFSPDMLNNFFSSVYVDDNLNYNFDLNECPSQHLELDVGYVENQLRKLKKTGGIPTIPIWIFKEFSHILAPTITKIFNDSLKSGIIPNILKICNITPIPKISKPSSVSDFRPISLQSPLLKILEKFVINNWIKPLLYNRPAAFKDQFAFLPIPNRGTQVALTLAVGSILQNLDQKHSVSIMAIDFTKAFDRVSVSNVMFSLHNINAPLECLYWYFNFMNDRHHRVFLDSKNFSDFTSAKSGVPQGSLSGPILFAIMLSTLQPINDHCVKYIKYADDLTVIYYGDKNNMEHILQEELSHINSWCTKFNMCINISKSKILPFNLPVNSLNIKVNDQVIDIVHNLKLLGIFITADLKWDRHIEYISSSICKRIYYLIQAKKFNCNPRTLLTIYYAFIRSIISYCYPSFCNLSQHLFNKLQKIENRAARIIGMKPNIKLNNYCKSICVKLFKNICTHNDHPLRTLFDCNRINSNRITRNSVSNNYISFPAATSSRNRNHFIKFSLNPNLI